VTAAGRNFQHPFDVLLVHGFGKIHRESAAFFKMSLIIVFSGAFIFNGGRCLIRGDAVVRGCYNKSVAVEQSFC